MNNLAYLVVLTILLVFSEGAENVSLQESDDLGTIVLASVIFRHGDRTPIDPYPLDPYRDLSYWPAGYGQLTNVGKEQHYQLGKWFRERYANLLPSNYSKEDILVRSTNVDRTLMSAASNLAGLYPPVAAQIWDSEIKWQPIPIHTLPEQMDEVLAGKKCCPKYDMELKKVKESEEMQELNRRYAELYEYLSANSGRDVHDIQGVEFIFSTLYIESLNNLTLPRWTQSVFPKKMAVPAARSFTIPAMNKELQRLKSGPLLGEIIEHMSKKAKSKLSPDRKMFMYSGHDTTIANMLMTLGVFKAHTPSYTATILIELRKNLDDKYVVTVWYRNATSTGSDPVLLAIPGCAKVCPLEQFINLTAPVVPTDWEYECEHPHRVVMFSSERMFNNPLLVIGMVGFGIVAVLLALLLVSGLLHWRYSRSASYIYHRLPPTNDQA